VLRTQRTFAVQFAKAFGAHVTAVTSARNVEVVGSLGPDLVLVLSDQGFRHDRYDVIAKPCDWSSRGCSVARLPAG